jgi:hypothetical protein
VSGADVVGVLASAVAAFLPVVALTVLTLALVREVGR